MTKPTPAATLTHEAENRATVVTIGDGPDAVTLTVPRKWQRFRFLRRINSGDVIGALESVFGAEAVEALDDIEIDDVQFDEILETLAGALSGTTAKNSVASPNSH
ncbi:hypothetical protein [Actinomadura sp. NEAU-AAG7]|uniref:hypothetical protein n=1 Tax=Actinomadura sp. NEAU-AAG7 TaxID=2839640 RepID=UPI001BE44A10|nr:hypothetical protein [Actinomadura sp. NEAU-AAG7]MBT2213457.1 hypothetical protein [Actinomadura sp. NEAU-AAG7]